jgi:hypothetical protein
MRKITEQIANAFARGMNYAQGNTMTAEGNIYLHGNKIIKTESDGVYMSLAGWNTVTTRERLNGVSSELGYKASFTQKNFEPYLNNKPINDDTWYKVA